jgi:hypothetical protein
MLYATVQPQRITLAPSSTTSFAASFNGAYAPKKQSLAACLAETMSVELPTTHVKSYRGAFTVPVALTSALPIGRWDSRRSSVVLV